MSTTAKAHRARQERLTASRFKARARPVAAPRVALSAATIRFMQETEPSRSSDREEPRPRLAIDESRLLMMRRVKRMTVEERLALFDRLSRRVTWARSAKRVR
jgi:hypothetical protein